jgi:hypothetical protein
MKSKRNGFQINPVENEENIDALEKPPVFTNCGAASGKKKN